MKTRKNCQYCRYKLCEEAGMKTTWVLTEEERKLKFEGKGKKRRSSAKEPEDVSLESKHNDCQFLSKDEYERINNYVAASDFQKTSKVNEMDTELIRKIIR